MAHIETSFTTIREFFSDSTSGSTQRIRSNNLYWQRFVDLLNLFQAKGKWFLWLIHDNDLNNLFLECHQRPSYEHKSLDASTHELSLCFSFAFSIRRQETIKLVLPTTFRLNPLNKSRKSPNIS